MARDEMKPDLSNGAQDTFTPAKIDVVHHEDANPYDDPAPRIHAKTLLIVAAVFMVYVAQVSNTVGAGAYRTVVAAEAGGAQDSSWLLSVTVILTVVLSPPISQAADYWGRRWFLIVPTFCGVIGAIIVSRAESMRVAIVGQTILGISFGAQPLLHAVASEVLTHRHRALAQATVNIGAGIGGIIGLLAGAALTANDPNGFRNYWYLTAGLYAVATVALLVLYTPPPRELQTRLSFNEKVRRLDWVGYFLLTIGLVLFVMGLSWADNPFPWRDGHVLGPFLVGAAFVIALILYQWKFKTDGMVHHGLFSRDRNFALALGCIFIEGLVFFAANAFFPYQVGVVYEPNPIRTNLHFFVAFAVYLVACPALGLYCYKYKRLRAPNVFAFSCFLAFNICMATTTIGSSEAVWGYPVFLGLGLAVALCALITAAQLSAPPELIATTSGLMIAVRSLGGAIGLAIFEIPNVLKADQNEDNAAFNGRLVLLPDNIAQAVLPLGLPSTSLEPLITALATEHPEGLGDVPSLTPEIIGVAVRALRLTFVDSFRAVWIVAACFTVLGVIAAFFFQDPVEDFNMHIDAPAEEAERLFSKRESSA